MKKYMEDFNEEELTEVFNANRKLRRIVEDDITTHTSMHTYSQLKFLADSLFDYNIDPHGKCEVYINSNKLGEFIVGLKRMQEVFPLLDPEGEEILSRMVEIGHSEEFTLKIKNEFQDGVEILKEKIGLSFDKQFENCTSREKQLYHFINTSLIYGDINEEEVYIIPKDGDYTLYKDVVTRINYR